MSTIEFTVDQQYRYKALCEYIDAHLTVQHRRKSIFSDQCEVDFGASYAASDGAPLSQYREIGELLEEVDESFCEMLLRKIDECGMSDVECYKKANIDRKHFSKIRSDRLYRPSKSTALSFAIALRLSLEETKELLSKAGFVLSHSSKFDIIVEYFIASEEYDIALINEALYAFDQRLL